MKRRRTLEWQSVRWPCKWSIWERIRAELLVESIDPEGPYGAKEAGEGPLHPSIPAIANAIYDAVGIRMDALPFSPPRVWRALQEHAAGGEERIAAD